MKNFLFLIGILTVLFTGCEATETDHKKSGLEMQRSETVYLIEKDELGGTSTRKWYVKCQSAPFSASAGSFIATDNEGNYLSVVWSDTPYVLPGAHNYSHPYGNPPRIRYYSSVSIGGNHC